MAAKYGKRKGLDGPVFYPCGRVLYFDPVEGKHWDPTTDFYIEEDEMNFLRQQLFDLLTKEHA